MLTSVQDAGRFGYQRDGISPAGAVDARSMFVANILVGNYSGEAVLETTVIGPEIQFLQANIFAVTGAEMFPKLNGVPVASYCAIIAQPGSKLTFSPVSGGGCRGYIAFSGGLDVALLLNSRSTLLRNGIGGVDGRKLKAGDKIDFAAPKTCLPNLERRWLEPEIFDSAAANLRVILGPQNDRFTKKGLDTFFGNTYTVTAQCDRMGCRLEGEPVEHVTDANIISDGIAQGAIQIPGNGQPIILLSERQSTGGYTKIATVISVDLPKIAQCQPGAQIRFRSIAVEEAQELYLSQLNELEELKNRFDAFSPQMQQTRTMNVIVDGILYAVQIAEIVK